MGKYLDELKKEYGVTGKSSSKSNGKQNSSSASSNKSNEKQNNKSTSSSNTKSKSSTLEALKKEYGVTGKYSTSTTNSNQSKATSTSTKDSQSKATSSQKKNIQFPNNTFNSQAVENLKGMNKKKETESDTTKSNTGTTTTKKNTVTSTTAKKHTGSEFLERLESQHIIDLPKFSTTAFNTQAVENLRGINEGSEHPVSNINSPDFATATDSAFRTARNKSKYDTTTSNGQTTEEVESRLAEINYELSELSKIRSGLGRASLYGNVGEQIKQNEERQAELKAEKRELERIGTFTAQEMVQWEIDDKKAEQRALGALTPNTRSSITPDEAEIYQERTKKYYGLENEIDSLEREKTLYDYMDKYDQVVEDDDFFGQWSASYGSNDISREADKAMNAYLNYPTEKNKEIAYAFDAFAKSYMENNENALDDENVQLGWLSQSLAGYLPQFEEQIIPELIGGGIGYAVGSAVGAPDVGSGLGAGIATFYPNYEVMRGSAYRTLIAEGVDEEVALEAASDEGLINSLIESGETAASWALSGTGKAWNAIKGAATKSVAKGSTNVATKYLAGLATKSATKATTKAAKAAARPLWRKVVRGGLKLGWQGLTEYGEEFLQQGVSIANREKARATVAEELGQYGNGNIDLHNRPIYENEDGTISTVDSVTYEVHYEDSPENSKYVLLPSIVRDENGKAKRLTTDDEIFAHYEETGEYLGEFDSLEEANAYATKLHTAQSYYYSYKYVDPDAGLVEGSADIVASAVTGKNPEALSQMHEAGTEGFKVGVMMGGSHLAVNNTIVRFANADSITKQNEIADTIIKDPKLLEEVIEAGKASGEGTVSEKVAVEIERTKDSGKKVSRDQIRRLLESTEVYKQAEEQTAGTTSTEKTSRSAVAGSGIAITPALAIVENKSLNGIPITVEEAQQASGYGEKGATILALTATYTKGKTFSQVKGEMHNAYYAGLSNKEMSYETPLEQEAYMAGREDRLANDFKLKEEAKNVVIHKNSGFYANNLPSDVTQSEVETLDLLAKSLGVKATTTEGSEVNAVLDKETGEVFIDLDFEREIYLTNGTKQKVSAVFYGAHEMAMHRVVELAPEEGSAFVYAMYDYIAGGESSRSITLADTYRYAYAEQGENISLATAMEEVSADSILRLYNNDEKKFHKAIESIVNGKNQQAKQGLMKYIDFLKQMVRKILNFLSGKSAKQKAEMQGSLDEIIRLRDMFESAVAKAVENKRAIESKAGTKSSKNLEIKINEEYNGRVSHSLKHNRKSKSDQYGVMWTLEAGILDNNEVAAFYEKISETNNNHYINYHKTADGQLIYELDDKLIYTDGNYHYPHISKVIAFNTEDTYWLEYGKESFYDGENYGYQTETITEIVEAVLGEGAIKTTTYESYETDKRSGNPSDERTTGTETNQRSRNDVGKKSYSLKHSNYLELAKNPEQNKAELEKMVYEAAKEAGFPKKLYHGTRTFGFTEPRTRTTSLTYKALWAWTPFFASNSLDVTRTYSGVTRETSIKQGNSWNEQIQKNYESTIDSIDQVVRKTTGDKTYKGDATELNAMLEKVKTGKYDTWDVEEVVSNYTEHASKEISTKLLHSEMDKSTSKDIYKTMMNAEREILTLGESLTNAMYEFNEKAGNYGLYANTENLFEIDCQGNDWNKIPFDKIRGKTEVKTRDVARWAKKQGYKGVKFINIFDSGEFGKHANAEEVYVFFNPKEQIKSADLVTYDDNGNIIPLSERFNKKNDNLRYSLKKGDINKLSTEEKKVTDALGKGAEAITNKNGEMLIATNENKSTVMYSLKTYKNGGKEALEKALRANGHTEAEIKDTLSLVDDAGDYLTILAAGYAKSHNYTALSNHLIADVITNVKTGKQVISSVVNNGEYPVNIDLALICKKRVAYMNLMNRLIDDGIFDKVNYGGEAIAKVNDLLRTDGFETACLGCFVESRRLQFQTWAETIVSEWNAEVNKRKTNAGKFNFADGQAKLTDAEMDALAEELKNAGKKNPQGNLNLGQGSVQTRMGRLLDKVPSLQKHLTVADLLKPEGLTALRAYDSNLFSIVKSRYGAASPKIVQDYNPYASEISMMTFSSVKNITSNAVKGADSYRRKVINQMGGRPVKKQGETTKAFNERKAEFNAKVEDEAIRRYLYDIGGARIQSFSDFMIENVFDYIQIFADLSAKRLPLHGYTKEIVALRLFGMTGAKWNGSWIAHVERSMGKEYAGLLPVSEAKNGNAILVHTDDGDYSIGFDDYARYKATDKKTFIQSIGMKDMIALQLDPRYSSYVGSITIGVSDKQILAMLDSPLFRFVIPYHSSGMLPQFAKLVGVDMYNDYTDYQNTTVKQWFDAYGNPCEPISDVDVDTSYNFNAEVQKTGDAKKAANNYLKWCGQKHPVYGKGKKLVGYVTFNPKFSNSPFGTDFTKHENYYKMLEDFNSYDNITGKSAVQGAVTMNFPSEQNRLSANEMEAYKERLRETGIFSEKEIEKYSAIANKTFKELIADEVKGRAEYQQAQSPKWENTVKNVENMLLADHKREMNSRKGIHVFVDPETRAISYTKELSKYIEGDVKPTEIYDEQLEKYGIIPSGEKPYREIFVPQKTAKNKKVSQTVRTVLEAKATTDDALPTIEKMVEDGIFSYDAYTDKQAIQDATDYLEEYGWVESLNDWLKDVNKGVVSKQHTAMGWALYNNAVNTASTTTSETERKNAMETALTVLDGMVRHQRSAAQALQATRILKTLSPETQLYAVQKSVNALQKELTEKYGKKAPDLKIDEQLAGKFLEAKTEEARIDAEIEIYKDIGRQLPSTFMDKWNAWRYLAMLGNVRTHVRNVFGNAFFAPVVGVKNVVATGIESIVAPVVKMSGKEMLRGKSLVWGSKTDRALLKAAWNDYANVADMVSNGGKYNDSAVANKHIEDGRKIFKSKLLAPLEWARKGNSTLLETEDVWFSKPHYAYALAMYCKANNITPEQLSRGKAIAPAREYAIKEAQKATYKDTNAFSHFVSKTGRGGHVPNAIGVAVEGILPFRKTPANILVRGVEYSPLGLLKGIADISKIGKETKKGFNKGHVTTASEVIDSISAGLTGTGLLALGVYFAVQGLVRGHGEDDEKEKKFKEMQGHQAYSLELPNGQSITLDWLAPEALPFFVGVNIWEQTKGKNEEVNMATILQTVTGITEPMLDMSCLQGLNDMIEGVSGAWNDDTSKLQAILTSAITSYLMQGIPTLLGQAERTGEEERMTTYTEKNDFLTGDMQYTLGKASAKIPGWDYNQIPYIDAWGRKEASGTALKRGLNNFLNPAYTSTIEESNVEKELLRLYEKTGETGVFPERADKYFTIDGERKDLTADEYIRYATLKGQNSLKAVTSLVNSKAYKKLTDSEKAKAVAEAYNYANQKAKKAISIKYKTDNWVSTADEFGSNVGGFLAFRTEISSTKDAKGDDFSKQDVIDIVLDMAQNDSEIWKMYLTQYDAKKDFAIQDAGIDGEEYMTVLQNVDKYDKPNKNGKLGTYTNDEITTAVKKTSGLTKSERAILWQEITGSSSTKNNPWRSYLPSSYR